MGDVSRDIVSVPTDLLQIRGFGVALPNDRLPKELLQIANNIRIYQFGELRVRPGLEKISLAALPAAIHSIISLNDPITGASRSYAICLGAGDKLYLDDALHTTFTAIQESGIDVQFSGDRLNFAIARPFQSPDPWLYVGDSLRTRKVRSDNVNYPWGTPPPIQPLTAKLSAPIFKVISDFEAILEDAVNWVAAGTASALAVSARLSALTLSYFQYDVGTTGWASVVPTSFPTDIQAGALITPSVNPEVVKIDCVYEQISSTTISTIIYDDNVGPGLCTIQPATPSPGLKLDMLIRLAGAENVRILSVTESPDGVITSFRCSTTAIRVAGDTIDGLRSFRAYFNNSHTSADTISANALSFSVAAGTGYISHILNRDLSNVSNRPITDEDDFHLSLQLDDSTQVQEIRLIFDLDPTTNDFQHNALFKVFRPSDFAAAATGSQTIINAQRVALSRSLIEQRVRLQKQYLFDGGYQGYYYGGYNYTEFDSFDPEAVIPEVQTDPSTTQTGVGTSQWSELKFKRKDLERIGTDLSRDLKDVQGIRIQILSTGTVSVKVDSLTVGGTYGPHSPSTDLSTLPYYYAYRYRSSITGTKSNFSPPIRSGLMPNRDSILLTPIISNDPQIDKIDYIRYGGAIQEWQIVGTGENLPGATFIDTLPDSAIIGKTPVSLTDNFQPFPTIDLPRKGTCSVNGTVVKRLSGDQFNIAWSRNSDIYINGVRHTLYTSPSDNDTIELNETGGSQADVTFYLPEPTILGRPLPSIWGPFGGPIFGDVIFACGDLYQPGVLFYTSPGDPDSTRDIYQLEICSGSEKLMNGCLYRGRSYISSSQQWYEIVPRFGYGYSIVDNLGAFIAQDTANTRALFARNCLTVGDLIYYLSQDGVYSYDGGQEVNISTDLYPLFPHDGVAGQTITLNNFGVAEEILPPDFTQLDKMSMEFYDSILHWTYQDIGGTLRTLVYSTLTKGWNSVDTFTPEIRSIYGVQREGAHQLLYGGVDGNLYKSNSAITTDNGVDIQARMKTGADDLGDPKVKKQVYDGWFDIGVGNGLLKIGVDDFSTLISTSIINQIARAKLVVDFNNGEGVVARNVGLDYSFTLGSILAWRFSISPLPEDTFLRATANWSDLGKPGAKRIQGIWIEADTNGQDRTVQIQADGVTVQTALINHNGLRESYHPLTPFIANELRVLPNDANYWRYFKDRFDFEPYPDLAQITPDFTDDGDIRPKWLQGFLLEADTSGQNVAVQLQGDRGVVIQTFNVNHLGREVKDYSLDDPYITHEMRLVPLGDVRMGAPFKLQWRWEPEPPLVTVYETQPTTLDQSGFAHLRDIYVTHRSGSDINLIISVDGQEFTYIIANGAGVQVKSRLIPQAIKGKVFSFRLESDSPFRLYQKDCEVWVGQWGRSGPYAIAKPFGDLSRIQGASI